MQEDDFKSKKSDIGDTGKKKKYKLRNRKEVEDMSDISMTLTDAISILDKHKTVKILEEDVTKKGNDEQTLKNDSKPRRRTRSSTARQTITEMLDEIFQPVNSENRDELMKETKNDDEEAGQVPPLLELHADGTENNKNAKETSHGNVVKKNCLQVLGARRGKRQNRRIRNQQEHPMMIQKKLTLK